ncbi:hypothetical protein IAR55_000777 [Kwoniella newhampshirensis]|uniref:Mediator complex subunit 9 n=1 Tax=Kwoniella newhampshirensis TaxID=1651941 RepID=A0AAW0Z3X0_9TREE
MAQQPPLTVTASSSTALTAHQTNTNPLQPGSFRSLLPTLNDILAILNDQGDSAEKILPAQASEQVAPKARELTKAIEEMKSAAMGIPGGHLSTEEVRRLKGILEEEGEKRRRTLRAFEEMDMPVLEELGQRSTTVGVDGDVDGTDSQPTPTSGLQ